MKKQMHFFKTIRSDYGVSLMTTRKGRSGPRPISTKHAMHLVLRSSQATGAFSFKRHRITVQTILYKFAKKYGIKVQSPSLTSAIISIFKSKFRIVTRLRPLFARSRAQSWWRSLVRVGGTTQKWRENFGIAGHLRAFVRLSEKSDDWGITLTWITSKAWAIHVLNHAFW